VEIHRSDMWEEQRSHEPNVLYFGNRVYTE